MSTKFFLLMLKLIFLRCFLRIFEYFERIRGYPSLNLNNFVKGGEVPNMPVPETDHLMTAHQTTKPVLGNNADHQTANLVSRQISQQEDRKTSIHEEVIEGVFKAVPVLLDDSMGEEEDILGKYFI